jgi:twitching motility protein PilT
MARLTRDEQLDELVRELNQNGTSLPEGEGTAGAEAPSADLKQVSAPPASIPEGNPLEKMVIEMAQRGASDLLLIAGSPPILRVGGRLVRTDAATLEAAELFNMLALFLSARLRERLDTEGAVDFSLRLGRAGSGEERRARRFRVNVHRQRGTLAAAIRSLPTEVPARAQLHLPPSLADLVKPTRGLVLVCGPTGSGKTTTLAALVGEINQAESKHVVTIEDPIEFEHRNQKAVIEQVEIGRDAPTFAGALRAALRQDPDVILVGEMRDLETISTALTAAETGHLILSTLHTSDAAQAINRIVDVFPANQQNQIRQQLALSLNAIVCQQLIPKIDGSGRVVAVEVLLANYAVRNLIRQGKLQQLGSEITMGRRQGMVSLEDSLARLVRQGLISPEDARVRSTRPDELESLLRT